jgi:hypothetical protein
MMVFLVWEDSVVAAFRSWDVLHFVQLTPERLGGALAFGSAVRPVRAGAAESGNRDQRIARAGQVDFDLHGLGSFTVRRQKQNGPVQ